MLSWQKPIPAIGLGLGLACGLWISPLRSEMTLSSSVAEVRVENLRVGRTYSLEKEKGAPLRIRYSGPENIVLRIEPIQPNTDELKPGHEAIPNVSWVHLEQSTFVVKSGEARVETDVSIRVPKRRVYKSRRFQFHIRVTVESLEDPPTPIAVALESRFLVSTDR